MATTITRILSTGVLQSNVEFDEVTQSAIKNLAIYSEDLTNSAWTKVSLTTFGNTATTADPRGTYNADLIIETNTTTRHAVIDQRPVSSTSTIVYTFSSYLKQYSGIESVTIWMTSASYTSGNRLGAQFNLDTGTLLFQGDTGLSTVISSSIEPAGNGWYRCSVSGSLNDTTTTVTYAIGLNSDVANRATVSNSYLGDGVSGIYVWGSQLEANPVMTPYQGIGADTIIITPDYSVKISPTGVYAAQFDEVNLAAGTAERKTNTGTYLVSGSFDEVTGMIVTTGLVAYYDAGKAASQPTTGATWYDISNTRSNATPSVSPPTYNSGGYFTFDRVNAQTYRTSALALTSWTEPWTIEVWMYVPSSATWSNGTNQSHFISRGQTTGSWGIIRGITDNQIRASIRTDAGAYQTGGSITRDAWYNVLGTWDGISTLSTYINGVLADSATATTLTGVPDTTDLLIGGSTTAWTGSPGIYYEGDIAIITMYNRALSAAEVNNNFEALRTRFSI